ncbi:hypothetical protein M0R45_012225 [Rubus argutus]|uniref:Tr-type G domain-containing protein n=1 Tax=Rubus argutus TaxID=59490 RepID=A0AAW1YCD5_RUBAR
MPRKVNYGLDYDDEDYDAYEDYDYDLDDDFGIENNGKELELKRETVKRDVWRCSICTYDNEENLTACDICGVLHNPLGRVGINSDKKSVEGRCKDSGASIMAKSLFASLPRKIIQKAVLFHPQKDDFVIEEGNKFHRLGDIQGPIHEFQNAFIIHKIHNINIAPFKFDVPSPDDVVSNGLRSSKVGSKASVTDLESSRISSKVAKKSSASAQSSAEWSDSSSVAQKDQQDTLNEGIPSGDRGVSYPHGSSGTKTIQSNDYKPEKWMLPDEGVDTLTQLNLAIVGHVDSGKSTLSGRLLHLLGRVSKKEMHKYEKEAKSQGKGSFAYAWALDESAEERERGITMNVAVAYFDSSKYHVVVLDSPGHKDFVPNMISGATQADAAILLVDASCGAFEAGIKGQTMEHAQLIRSFGVDQIIVAVNKMDVVEYSKDRFDEIKQTLGTFLQSRGFKNSYWVPLSVMENQNLVSAPSEARLLSWYHGPSLLDAIDSLQPPTRDFQKPLLMPICDVIRSTSLGQVSACGKLEAGALRSGSKVLVMPSGELGTVRSLERDSQACSIARAGDNVGVTLQGIDGGHVMAGAVLCHPGFPVAFAKHLELKVLLLDVATPILIGSQLEFHIHHAKEAARVRAVIEVILQGPVCVEEFSKSRALGSVSLRASGNTVALGVVTRIIKELE